MVSNTAAFYWNSNEKEGVNRFLTSILEQMLSAMRLRAVGGGLDIPFLCCGRSPPRAVCALLNASMPAALSVSETSRSVYDLRRQEDSVADLRTNSFIQKLALFR